MNRVGILGAFVDSAGDYLDGAKSSKVTLPPNIPAARILVVHVYDNPTRLDVAERPARCFGPTKPADVERDNWIQTVPGKGWNKFLRLYSPSSRSSTSPGVSVKSKESEIIGTARTMRAARPIGAA